MESTILFISALAPVSVIQQSQSGKVINYLFAKAKRPSTSQERIFSAMNGIPGSSGRITLIIMLLLYHLKKNSQSASMKIKPGITLMDFLEPLTDFTISYLDG